MKLDKNRTDANDYALEVAKVNSNALKK